MKLVYLDKKERVRAWFTPVRVTVCAALALVILFVPWWPEFVEARFLLEPAQHAVIRAEAPGVVREVMAAEGDHVAAGTVLVSLRNLQIESAAALVRANLHVATARATEARLRYADFSGAENERRQLLERDRELTDQLSRLQITTPIAGVLVTPYLADLAGQYLEAGTVVAEVSDLSKMIARIYIPEFGIRNVRIGTQARLELQSRVKPVSGELLTLAPMSTTIDPGLTEKAQLSGIVPPPFYVGSSELKNHDGSLREGMTGTAKLLVGHRSAVEFAWRFVRDLVQRRFW